MSATHETGTTGTGRGDLLAQLRNRLLTVEQSPVWTEVQATARPAASNRFLSGVRQGIRTVKPVKANAVKQSLEQAAGDRPKRELVIANTVAFAKNVLEAEQAALERAEVNRAYHADSVELRQGSSQQHLGAQRAKTGSEKLIVIRAALPIERPDATRLRPSDQPVFFGLAELYGMARAGYQPSDLERDLRHAHDLIPNPRTTDLVQDCPEVVQRTVYEGGAVNALETMGVNLPLAIEVASSPTQATVLSAAQQIARA